MKKLAVAVIGLGYWGPNILRNLLKIPSVTKVYGCDLDEKKLACIKKEFPNVQTSNDFSIILATKEIDAVVIATPLKSHFQLGKQALLANKHVLIEKPMTENSKQARELISLAQKQKKILMVGHTFIYSETVNAMKAAIKKKTLGKIYYYDSSRINLGLIQQDANVVWDLAPHDLSILRYLFPEKPISVQAFASSFIGKQYEIAHIFIRFEKGISAHIHVSWLSPVKIRSTIIGGSKKMIVCNEIEPSEKIKIYDKGVVPPLESITPFAPAYRSGDVIIPHIPQKEALLTQLSHFVTCIKKNKKPLTSGEEGREVVQLLEAIEKAIQTHKEITL